MSNDTIMLDEALMLLNEGKVVDIATLIETTVIEIQNENVLFEQSLEVLQEGAGAQKLKEFCERIIARIKSLLAKFKIFFQRVEAKIGKFFANITIDKLLKLVKEKKIETVFCFSGKNVIDIYVEIIDDLTKLLDKMYQDTRDFGTTAESLKSSITEEKYDTYKKEYDDISKKIKDYTDTKSEVDSSFVIKMVEELNAVKTNFRKGIDYSKNFETSCKEVITITKNSESVTDESNYSEVTNNINLCTKYMLLFNNVLNKYLQVNMGYIIPLMNITQTSFSINKGKEEEK